MFAFLRWYFIGRIGSLVSTMAKLCDLQTFRQKLALGHFCSIDQLLVAKKKQKKKTKKNKNNNKIKERKRPKDNAIEKRRFISIYFRLRRVFFYLLRHSDFVCLLAFLSGSSKSRDPLNQFDSFSSFVSNRSADVTVHYSNRQHM